MLNMVDELNDILDGKTKADGAHDDVQAWLRITCFMLAKEVAETKTKQGRVEQLETVKRDNPLFYDDVKSIAKEIFKNKGETK